MTGTLLDVNIDRDDPAWLHEQVAPQIRPTLSRVLGRPPDNCNSR